MCDVRAMYMYDVSTAAVGVVENHPGKQERLHQPEIGFVEESYVQVI
jgi:hypothetical protein